jgi:uncharacterized protein
MCAAERTCCTAVQAVLLQAGADPCARAPGTDITALHRAAGAGAVESCKLLLARSATLLEDRDMYGRSALRCAANAGSLSIVQVLVQHGADVNTVDHKGRTPLFGACLYQHVSVAAFLLEAGAGVNAVDQDGSSVLTAAAQAESTVALVQLLLDHGVDISATDSKGQHALFSAARFWSVALMEKLVSCGLSVHTVSTSGNTVLMIAVAKGRTAVAEWLLQQGVAVNAANNNGSTALHFASETSECADAAMIELLLANGADVHMCTLDGRTALDKAAYKGNLQCTKALIAAGADVNHTSRTGGCVLHTALMEPHAAVVQLLLEHGATAVVN